MPNAVSVSGLTKRYANVVAANDVSFEIPEGEIFGLIGPNGAGKTTVLESILGLISPDAGSVAICGQPLPGGKALVGAQLQTSALPDMMTPRQALTLCGKFYAHPTPAAELLRLFDLTEKADERYGTLSVGQRQRVALALALVNRPKVLVLDEPTAGLDPPSRSDLHRLIQQQRAAGRTVLFSTHYLEEARRLCDRVALMHRGSVVALDTPESLIARSGAQSRVSVRTSPALPAEAAAGVGAVADGADGWSVTTDHVQKSVTALVGLAESRRVELLDVQIHRPTLEDAFARFTA
ncbi:MAG TPA: ABC transporter ATP-binding protein [Opitutaceae bacterium]|jgi:ABC-2 type transport system ATP-binding protein